MEKVCLGCLQAVTMLYTADTQAQALLENLYSTSQCHPSFMDKYAHLYITAKRAWHKCANTEERRFMPVQLTIHKHHKLQYDM